MYALLLKVNFRWSWYSYNSSNKKNNFRDERNGVKFIIFSGGEPLTRKDLFEIADFCKDNGIITYLSSNGLYFTKGNVQRIVDTFNYVGVSIDGDEPTHDHFRGLKGAFKKSLSSQARHKSKKLKLINNTKRTSLGN